MLAEIKNVTIKTAKNGNKFAVVTVKKIGSSSKPFNVFQFDNVGDIKKNDRAEIKVRKNQKGFFVISSFVIKPKSNKVAASSKQTVETPSRVRSRNRARRTSSYTSHLDDYYEERRRQESQPSSIFKKNPALTIALFNALF